MVAVFCFRLIVKEKRLLKYCFLNQHLCSRIIFVQIFRKIVYCSVFKKLQLWQVLEI